jgi:hypothetical protein
MLPAGNSGTRSAVHRALCIAAARTYAADALSTERRRGESEHQMRGLQQFVRQGVLASDSSVRVEVAATALEARSEHTCSAHCFFTIKVLQSSLRHSPYWSLWTRSVGPEARPTSAGKLWAMCSDWC